MAMVKKSITVTDQQAQWIQAQIATGNYASDSEVLRDLIRREQKRSAKLHALQQAIQEGLDSGISDKTVEEIWAEAVQRHRAKHG
jgi:antitoxin ParD1/3/4